MDSPVARVELHPENIYGHRSRLLWIRDHLHPKDRVLELGCGTGYMITLPLRLWGYDVIGIDTDEPSIRYGRELMRRSGQPEDALLCTDIAGYRGSISVVVASEVFEHIPDEALDAVLAELRDRLSPDGRLLVTVPNGYSWFELESALWFKLRIGAALGLLQVPKLVDLVKAAAGVTPPPPYLSTIADSPHVHRFTLRSIRERLESNGFEVVQIQGSALICGPFSNLLLTGFRRVMAMNVALGRRWPRLASDFQLEARPKHTS